MKFKALARALLLTIIILIGIFVGIKKLNHIGLLFILSMELDKIEKQILRNALAVYRKRCPAEWKDDVSKLELKFAPESDDYLAGPYLGTYDGCAYQYVLVEHTNGLASECQDCPFKHGECSGIICSPGVVPRILRKIP